MQRHGRRRERQDSIAAEGHGSIHSPPRSTEKREREKTRVRIIDEVKVKLDMSAARDAYSISRRTRTKRDACKVCLDGWMVLICLFAYMYLG